MPTSKPHSSICKSLRSRSISNMRGLSRNTSGPCRVNDRDDLPLCPPGTSVGPPVPANRRVHYSRSRPRLGPCLRRRGASVPDLSRRSLSICLFAKRTAPRPAHPRLVCPSAFTQTAAGFGRLQLSPAVSARHSGGACLECADSGTGSSDPPRGHSTHSATPAPAIDGGARSVDPAGITATQRPTGQRLPAAAPRRTAHR